MREESHLDDMRAAVRGDFDRLEERRGEQVLLRPHEQPGKEIETETTLFEPAPVASKSVTLQQTVARDEVDESPKRSWIDRLLRL